MLPRSLHGYTAHTRAYTRRLARLYRDAGNIISALGLQVAADYAAEEARVRRGHSQSANRHLGLVPVYICLRRERAARAYALHKPACLTPR